MSFNFDSESDEEQVISVINTTPLVDVMLVLLIIFLITIPVVTRTIQLNLPEESNHRYEAVPNSITLAINAKGEIYWNEQYIPNHEILLSKLKIEATQNPQSEVLIRGDQETVYETIAEVITAVQGAGISKIAFIIQPPAVA